MLEKIREHLLGADVLAALSITGAALTGEYLAVGIIALMLITGRALERWAEGQAECEFKALLARMPRTARRLDKDGEISEIAISQIEVGDRLLVRNGEITPTDGTLLSEAQLDESALTGEPLPVAREIGSEISSGVVNASAPFEYTATTKSETSTYAGIIALVKAAQTHSAPGIRIANKLALYMTPIALTIAGLAWAATGDVKRAVAVLVAATPCPLILAVPIAIVAGLSRAAKVGAIIKGGAILELLARTDTVLLDKTGTLTHGGPAVTEINTRPGLSDDELLQIAASIDQYSPHIVAKALVAEARVRTLPLRNCEDISEEAGHRISGLYGSQRVVVGQLDQSAPSWLHLQLPLMVAVSIDGDLAGVIGLQDPIRPESMKMVADLRSVGVKHIALVTGDREETALEVAEQVGITEIFSSITAAGKLEIARGKQSENHGVIVVVGDGINDAPALAAADVGVAMGARGASAASEAADVVIVEDCIDRLTKAIVIAQVSRKKALQAAAIGIALSFIVMGTGALGYTDVSQGAIAQEVIDVISILWALTTLKAKVVRV